MLGENYIENVNPSKYLTGTNPVASVPPSCDTNLTEP